MAVSQEVRRAVWERDGGICQLCFRPVPFDRLMHADHIVPSSLGGDDDLLNLRASHRPCNIRRGDGLNRGDKRPRGPIECDICGVVFQGILKISYYCPEHQLWKRRAGSGRGTPAGEGGGRGMSDPNDDPTTLTVDKLHQAGLGAILGVTLRRRRFEYAERDAEHRCPCGGPATLFSFDLLASQGKAIFLCDACSAKVIRRAVFAPAPERRATDAAD